MPTYDYECEKCGKRFELFQKMSAEPISSCPKCKGKAHRLIGIGSGVIFKGSGFYHTDYNKKTKEEKSCPKSDSSSDSCKSCSLNKNKK